MVKEEIVLGYKVSSAGLEVDKAKIDVISKLPPLLILKLLEKDTPFEFDDKCQKAFELLKEKLTCAPVIVSPNWNLPFELMCDASDFIIRAVLWQKDSKNIHLIYFASKTLNPTQQKYTVTEKELMAIVFAFDKFRSYLILLKTIIHTDHSALRHLFKKQDAKPQLIRWILLLQEFDIEIKNIKGTENIAADHLSRIENDETSDDSEVDDNFPGETLVEINTKDEPTINLRNEISNFQQHFDESFHEAWDRYKVLLLACPHHGFTKLHQLDTFYNALNPSDQDSLNSAASGNLLERRTQDVLTIIENKSKVCNSRNKLIVSQVKSSDVNSSFSSEIAKFTDVVNQQTSAMTTAMTAILKQFQATPPPAFVKAIEEIYVTCGGAHPYYQCLTVDGNTFLEFQDNIQGYISVAVVNYNQDNSDYRPPIVPLSELEKIKKINEVNIKAMQAQINNGKNELRNEMQTSIQASMSNQTNKLKNTIASFFQMNTASTSGSGPLSRKTIANPKGELKTITTRSGLVLDGPFVPMPPPFINLEEDERAEETLTNPELADYTIKQEKDEIQIHKFWQMFKQLHINITLADALILIPKYQKMLTALLSNKKKFLKLENTPLNENFLAVIIKKLPKKLGDLGNFLFRLPELIFTRMTLELANRAISTPAKIARDVFTSVGKFTFPADFVIVDYESDPRVLLILGRPFLRTARALIDVHEEEMIPRDGDERLTVNMRHDTSSYTNQPKELINMINIYNDSYEDYLEDLFAKNHLSSNPTFSSHTDLTSPKVINLLSGNTTSSFPDHLLEEFADKLALITFSPRNDDLLFDIESDLREIEYFLNHDPTKEMDSILEDSVNEGNLVDPNNDLVDTIPEMFTDEHTLDYSSPPLYDDVDDDLVELESDNDDVYDDPFDSKEDKIKESKTLLSFSFEMRKRFSTPGFSPLKEFILLFSWNYLIGPLSFQSH
nr:reverse transcriptase domain-containing protein [Tanacetum cinerariifolium]